MHQIGGQLGAKIKSDPILGKKVLVVSTGMTQDALQKELGWDPLTIDAVISQKVDRKQLFEFLKNLHVKKTGGNRSVPLALIIDDSVVARSVLKKEMEFLGFQVETAQDGKTGIEMVNKLYPDIVLTDVEMPGMSGYQVCEILSSDPSTSQIPVCVISGSVTDKEVRHAFNSGAIDFLPKPVDPKQLSQVVATLMGRSQKELRGTALVFEDNQQVASIIMKLLSDIGLRTQICRTSFELEAYLSVSSPDIITLDINLPKGQGVEMCRRLRKIESIKATPIIVISGAMQTADMVECLRAGANDFMIKPFTKEEFNARIQIHLRTKQLQDELAQKIRIMENLAYNDTLTGLMNRRFLDEGLKREIQRSKRNNVPLGVILMDLDHFKKKNDTYGHAIGDQILAGVAAVLRDYVRLTDFACRYGGEEFCVLLPGATSEQAKIVAERIRSNCEKKRFSEKELEQTVSIGVSSYPHPSSETSLIVDSDEALYSAKESGRNRVVIFEGQPGGGAESREDKLKAEEVTVSHESSEG